MKIRLREKVSISHFYILKSVQSRWLPIYHLTADTTATTSTTLIILLLYNPQCAKIICISITFIVFTF